jgi:hypothetical protein
MCCLSSEHGMWTGVGYAAGIRQVSACVQLAFAPFRFLSLHVDWVAFCPCMWIGSKAAPLRKGCAGQASVCEEGHHKVVKCVAGMCVSVCVQLVAGVERWHVGCVDSSWCEVTH